MVSAAVVGLNALRAASDGPIERTRDGYPNDPLLLMAPANPGGGWDQTARVIQRIFAERHLSPEAVEVFNRGGAGGTIGLAELVGRHRRDPYTLMVGGSVMVGATIAHASPFALTDTTPIARLVNEYEVVAVPTSSPFHTLSELLDAFRRDPASVSWGGGSAGGVDHILVGLLARHAGVAPGSVRYVAFAGGGEAAAAVMGGQITAAISGFGEWKGLADGSRLRLLGISSGERLGPDSPPTFRELGVDIVLANWRGVFAPPGIPSEARTWLTDTFSRLRATDDWRQYLSANHWEDSFMVGPEFERFLVDDAQATAAVLRDLGLGTGGAGYAVIGPWTFPAIILVGLAASLFYATRSGRPVSVRTHPVRLERPMWYTAALLAAYLAVFDLLGFLLSTAGYLSLQAWILGSPRTGRNVSFGVLAALAAYGLFNGLLDVHLPAGDWMRYLRD